jgi:outer membrane immunogenic protein
MRNMSSIIAAAALAVGLSQAATAADLPRKAPPAPLPPPPLTWTGCYIGVNVGAVRGRFELDVVGPLGGSASGSRDGDWGFAGGGQFGCDYQFAGSGFVIGFRNMFDGTTNDRDRTFTVTGPAGLVSATGTAEFNNRWFDALTGRVGYSWGPGLVYFQGGAVWSRIEADIALATTVGGVTTVSAGSFSDTKTGWTVGGGVEYRFAPQWSVFVEGNYYDFGSRDRVVVSPVGTACQTPGCLFSGNTTAVSVLAGVNYRFWGGM